MISKSYNSIDYAYNKVSLSMEYELPKNLKKSIRDEVATKGYHNRKAIFASIAKEVFPDVKQSALIIGDKVELVTYV